MNTPASRMRTDPLSYAITANVTRNITLQIPSRRPHHASGHQWFNSANDDLRLFSIAGRALTIQKKSSLQIFMVSSGHVTACPIVRGSWRQRHADRDRQT